MSSTDTETSPHPYGGSPHDQLHPPDVRVGTAINVVPSAFAGGIQGVSRDNQADDVGNMQTVFLVVESTIGGTIAGAIGFGAGLVGGIAFGALQHTGKGSEQIGQANKDKVDPAVADKVPSG